jgi:type VI secretion system protein ImpG
MIEDLLPFYNSELQSLKTLAREFSKEYPKIASRLMIEGDTVGDPHVERLIQSVAFLSARVHHKLDEQFPEITTALLNVLYPHLLRPIPSMSIAQFQVTPDKLHLSDRYTIERHRELFSKPIDGMPVRFRTSYPVDLWPIRISNSNFRVVNNADFSVELNTIAALSIKLEALGGTAFHNLNINHLRFYIDGVAAKTAGLYEWILNSVSRIEISNLDGVVVELPPSSIRPVGFHENDNLVDYDARSLDAYRYLYEYFVFPEKFSFFDLTSISDKLDTSFNKELEIKFFCSEFARSERQYHLSELVNTDTLKLGCTPVVNLFRQQSEPLSLEHQRDTHRVVPDIRRTRGLEIYDINSVTKIDSSETATSSTEYRPFYSVNHSSTEDQVVRFWFSKRKPSLLRNDEGTEVFLSVVDDQFNPMTDDKQILSLELTCLNRDLPNLLPFGGDQGVLTLDGEAPVNSILFLKKPSPTKRPNLESHKLWRLVSHLSLNHMSIVSNGVDALKEIFNLYNFNDSSVVRNQIDGILNVSCESAVTKLGSPGRQSFVKGIAITIDLDEDKFEGSSALLFSTVLDHFFGLYATINSFTQLTVTTRQREKVLLKCKPRAGKSVLV